MMRLSLLSTVAATAVAFSVPLARAQTNGTAPYKSILGLWYDSADCTGIPNVILTPVGPDSTTKYVWDTSLSDCYTTYVASGEPSLTSTNAAAGPDRCNMLNFLGVCRAGDQTQETGSYLQKLVGDWTTLPHAGTPSGPKPSLFPDEILKDSAAANRPYIVSSQVG
ncbi:uncharacterized protein EV422DRAFT_530214 [Fimicolochytrium jonesii]|uniref:uncharacterized protein n=1 Tax=Fimicolochytrium jonesii TaxID=1396493 RepID=UPI0022FEB2C2|nr:uncharacterized protein EV422DRAFT_530214 [Fimicolochytrium jonesii]KAI8820797.1 hypothetical protein EV422DRAFT_530214 [Fimicolochytrium jonesii]